MGAASTKYISEDEAIVMIYTRLAQKNNDDLEEVLDVLFNNDYTDIRLG